MYMSPYFTFTHTHIRTQKKKKKKGFAYLAVIQGEGLIEEEGKK